MTVAFSDNVSENIILQSLDAASARIRISLFANLILCAVIVSNIFIQTCSVNEELLKNSPRIVAHLEEKIKQLERNNPNSQRYHWANEEDNYKVSALEFLVKRRNNEMGAEKIPVASIPLIGFSVSINDINAICGVFMIVINLWLLFSAAQINYMFEDKDSGAILNTHKSFVRHMFSTIHPHKKNSFNALSLSVIFAPAAIMTIAAGVDIYTLYASPVFEVINPYKTFEISFVIMTIVILILFTCAVILYRQWCNVLSRVQPPLESNT